MNGEGIAGGLAESSPPRTIETMRSWIYRHGLVKSHYVCVPCRVSKKSPVPTTCVHCGENLYDAGADFRPPRKTNNREWKKLEILFANGARFPSGGYAGRPVGVSPKSLGSVRRTVRRENERRTKTHKEVADKREWSDVVRYPLLKQG